MDGKQVSAQSTKTSAFTPGTEYLDRYYRPVAASEAKFKKVTTLHDSITTIYYYNLKNKSEISEHYKNGRPVGKWQETFRGDVYTELNFDEITYISVDELPTTGEIDTVGAVSPKFRGGEKGRIKYLVKNTKYPPIAIERGYQGTTIVHFVVNHTGQIENVVVTKSSNPYLDYEAVRVVKKMPRWKPATKDGKTVKVLFGMPLVFRIPLD